VTAHSEVEVNPVHNEAYK